MMLKNKVSRPAGFTGHRRFGSSTIKISQMGFGTLNKESFANGTNSVYFE